MKVHIFQDENIYNASLMELLHKNFDLSGHIFIFRCTESGKYTLPGSINTEFLPGFRNLTRIREIASSADRIFFHILPMGPDLLFWSLNSKIFRKAVWIYWGADIYAARLRYKSLKQFIYHIARRNVIRQIPYIAGFLQGDFDLIQSIYRTRATYEHVVYPIPTNFELCDKLPFKLNSPPGQQVKILLGNSGSATNRHMEMIRLLARFRDENISIYCPLSYGAKKPAYVQKVIREGTEIFGPNFKPIMEFMKPEEYIELLKEMDVAVMNHDRQQGLGNTLSLLYLGKKIYLRKDTTSYDYFTGLHISTFDINEITKMSFREFVAIDRKDAEQNKEILRSALSETAYLNNWKRIIEL